MTQGQRYLLQCRVSLASAAPMLTWPTGRISKVFDMSLKNLLDRIYDSVSYRLEKRRWQRHEWRKRRMQRSFKGQCQGPIFIVGCQRSGTTHLERLFRADPRSSVFGEFSDLSLSPAHTRWLGWDDMNRVIGKNPGTYTVIRSLLMSHRVIEIMGQWPCSSVIWMFRNPNDVVDSMLRKWGGEFERISEAVESDFEGNWDLRELWSTINSQVKMLGDSASDEDYWRNVYAVFWVARNQLMFDLRLHSNPRVHIVNYSDFIAAPDLFMRHFRRRVSVSEASWYYPLSTHASSHRIDKPRFAPAIQGQCDELYERMMGVSEFPSDP